MEIINKITKTEYKKLKILFAANCFLLILVLTAIAVWGICNFKAKTPYKSLKAADVQTVSLFSDGDNKLYAIQGDEQTKLVAALNKVKLGGKVGVEERDEHIPVGGGAVYTVVLAENDGTISVLYFWDPEFANFFSINGQTYRVKNEEMYESTFNLLQGIAKREFKNFFTC